jgi:holo-[acyl-carrier protein] synthase
MKFAVGVDIIDVARIGRMLDEHPASCAEIFTELEWAYCAGKKNRTAHLAARFAAKEAVLKALGTGLGPGMRWTDVEVNNDSLGRPHLVLHGLPAAMVTGRGGSAEVSLSHTRTHAIANAAVFFPTPEQAPPTSGN